MTMVDTDLDLDAAPPQAEDHEPISHIVRQDDITHSLVTGEKVQALCGRWFVVKMLQPDLDVCQPCLRALANHDAGDKRVGA